MQLRPTLTHSEQQADLAAVMATVAAQAAEDADAAGANAAGVGDFGADSAGADEACADSADPDAADADTAGAGAAGADGAAAAKTPHTPTRRTLPTRCACCCNQAAPADRATSKVS